MARVGLRRFGVLSMLAVMLATSFSHIVAPVAHAFIGNPITADSSGDPTDTFRADDALFAFFTVDITGGDICVVNVNIAIGPGVNCESGIAWGSPNHFVGLGLQYEGLEAPYLVVGTWRLLAAPTPTTGNPTPTPSVSAPFYVSACADTCDTSIGAAAISAWKASAGAATEGGYLACEAMAIQSTVSAVTGLAGQISTMRGILYDVANIPSKGIRVGLNTSLSVAVDFAGGLIAVPLPDFSSSEEMAMALLQRLLCSAALMHDTIMQDPPDPNFTTVAQPVFTSVPNPNSNAGQVLGTSLDRQRAFSEAMLHAFERYLGAKDAGQPDFVALQARAMAEFGIDAAQEMRTSARLLRDYGVTLGADPALVDPIVPDQATLDRILSTQARIRTDGFLPEELTELSDEGYTTAEVAQIRAMFDLDFGGFPVGVSIDTVLNQSADQLDGAAAEYDAIAREAASVASILKPNHAPVASFTAVPAKGESPLDVTFTDTSSDVDGDPLTASWDFGDGGTDTGASVHHVYAANGDYTATMTVSDGSLSTQASQQINVAPDNPPVAVDDTAFGGGPNPISILPLGNDTDADGDALSITGHTDPAHGGVTCDAFSCTYTPNHGFAGADSFDYTVSDGTLTDSATVFLTVDPAADQPPVLVPHYATTTVGVPVNIDFLAGATDPDGDPISLVAPLSQTDANGTIECQTDGHCTYTPAPAALGEVGYPLTISDGIATIQAPAVINITTGLAFEVGDVFAGVPGDTVFHYRHDGTQVEVLHSYAAGARFQTGMCFDAAGNLFATDFGGHLNKYDNHGRLVTADFANGTLDGNDDESCVVTHDGRVVVGSADSIGAHIHIFSATGTLLKSLDPTAVDRGLDWIDLAADGCTLFYNSEGTAVRRFDICTGQQMDDFATVQNASNCYALRIRQNGEVLAACSGFAVRLAPDGSEIQRYVPEQGEFLFALNLDPDGTSFWTGGYNTVKAYHVDIASGDLLDTIQVSGTQLDGLAIFGEPLVSQDHAPVGVADAYSTAANTALHVAALTGVLANDTDEDGDALTAAKVTDPAHGSLTLNADGSFDYTPNTGFTGDDTFTYQAGDGSLSSAATTVTITVGSAPTNHPPVATDDSADAAKDGPAIHIDVLANDTDADSGDTLVVASVDTTGTAGSVVNNGTDVTYTPAAGFTGTDTFTYTVSDGHGGTDTATVAVTVKGNGPPVATDDTANANEHGPAVHIDVLANDTDPDSDALSITSVDTTGTAGVVTNNGTDVTYDPNGTFDGLAAGQTDSDTFTYTVSDGHGGTDTATVTVTIHGQNDAPSLASAGDQTIPEMVLFNTLTLAGSDPDGDALTYSVQSGPTGLTVGMSSGILDWTPSEAQGPGDYPVNVRVTDPDGLHADRLFNIHVTEVNQAPSLAAIADQTVHPGDLVSLTAVGSDPDLPANTLGYSLFSGPSGAAVNSASGAFTWTASSTLGNYDVTIRVSDGAGGSADRTFTIHVVRDSTTLTLGGDTSGQYSDHASITATLKVGSTGVSGASVSISLGAASQTVTTNASGVASATFTIPGPAGSLATAASFAGTLSKAPSSASGSFTVNREDSTIVYSGDSMGLAGATIHLAATFTDSAAAGFTGSNPETGVGATIGDITKARVAFDVYNAGTCLSGPPVVTLSAFVTDTGTAGDGIGTATVTWSSSSEGSFCVVPYLVGATGTGANGYYTAPPAEPAGLAVFIDTAGKVTGGGWVAIGDGRGNFGFNATSTGTKVKGNLVFIERTVYRGTKAMLIIKSNAIDSLRTSGSIFPITATLSGKASFKYISSLDGSTLYESGNASFAATVVDTGVKGPPTGDSFAIRALDKAGAVLVDLGPTPLGGGNIVAHLK